jgi:hypothetical protein
MRLFGRRGGQRRGSFVDHGELPTKADWVGSTGLTAVLIKRSGKACLWCLTQLGHVGHLSGRVDRGIVERASAQDGGVVGLERIEDG